jgi:hypothetical protein
MFNFVGDANGSWEPQMRPGSRQACPTNVAADGRERGTEVRSQIATALYVALMAAMIVAIDLLFFRNRFWERLTVNLGIVLIFAAFYFRFLKGP